MGCKGGGWGVGGWVGCEGDWMECEVGQLPNILYLKPLKSQFGNRN